MGVRWGRFGGWWGGGSGGFAGCGLGVWLPPSGHLFSEAACVEACELVPAGEVSDCVVAVEFAEPEVDGCDGGDHVGSAAFADSAFEFVGVGEEEVGVGCADEVGGGGACGGGGA